MKTRIISGIVMALIVAAVLVAGFYVPAVVTVFIALLSGVAVYELVRTAAGVEDTASIVSATLFGVLAVLGFGDPLGLKVPNLTLWLAVIYFLIVVVLCLKNHKSFSLSHLAVLCAMPLPLAFAFSCLGRVINGDDGYYYLLLLFNFSSVCDMGAYFVGVTCGKHKLCPEISPKKTVEGLLGGFASSLVVAVILCLSFGFGDRLVKTLLLTIPFCAVGVCGDLFASVIKRTVGIKDYGRLIPGHGGVLDRMDSILLIAPLLWLCVEAGLL